MSAAPFLALLTIGMLPLSALRLELNFRRTSKPRARPELRSPGPRLRMTPAAGYCQASLSATALRNS
ncbi:MAG: hypothetical protein QOJ27_1136 [Sphingomonadales bacterium]|nr:hypothetical protein [Sphingomonadales bacterium]